MSRYDLAWTGLVVAPDGGALAAGTPVTGYTSGRFRGEPGDPLIAVGYHDLRPAETEKLAWPAIAFPEDGDGLR